MESNMTWRVGLAGSMILLLIGCGGYSRSPEEMEGPAAGAKLGLLAFGGPSGYVGAQVVAFNASTAAEEPSTCSQPKIERTCQLTACKDSSIDTGNSARDFGPILVSVGTTTEELTFGRRGYPQAGFDSEVTLDAGDQMEFQGEGTAQVPNFDVFVTIPDLAIITSPLPEEDAKVVTIDTTEDLSVGWEPISIGHINFRLLGGPLGGSTPVLLDCQFEGTDGAAVVPKNLLSSMKELSGDRVAWIDPSFRAGRNERRGWTDDRGEELSQLRRGETERPGNVEVGRMFARTLACSTGAQER